MKKILLTVLFLQQFSALIWAQNSNAVIKKVIDDFFVAMEKKDTVALDSLMHTDCMLFSSLEQKGAPIIEASPERKNRTANVIVRGSTEENPPGTGRPVAGICRSQPAPALQWLAFAPHTILSDSRPRPGNDRDETGQRKPVS